MNKTPLILCCLTVWVDTHNGVSIHIQKYRAKFSGKNYVAWTMGHDEADWNLKEGFSGKLRHRIDPDDLSVPSSRWKRDSSTEIAREIWYLEENEDAAVKAIRNAMADAVTINNNNAKILMDHWCSRHEKHKKLA